MKLFALLISLFVGFAAAKPEFYWESGKEYRFGYSGRMLTGLPELSNQFSGLAINATISLQVKEGKYFSLRVENPKFVAVNQDLQAQESSSNHDEGNNWRKLRLPEMESVPQEYAQTLKKPIVFNMKQDGSVTNIQIDSQEPLWSRNFKKALINLFQAKMQSEEQLENMINSPLSMDRPYWTVTEQSIIGECEASYQVNSLPEYLIRSSPVLITNQELCQGQEYFEVVRSINLEKCNRLATFQRIGTGEFIKCSPDNNNCANNWGRTSSIKYIACGSPSSGKMTVQSIINDGETNIHLLGKNTENVVSGTRQNLTLLEINQSSDFPRPQSPITLDSLLYEHTPAEGRPQQQSSQEREYHALPNTFLSGVENQDQVSRSEIEDKILKIIKDTASDIHSETKLSESQIGMKLLTVARGLTTLKNSEEIMHIFNQLQRSSQPRQESTEKQLFLDACAAAGTQPVIRFFEQIIKNGQISEMDIANYFFWLPHNVVLPHEQTLKGLFNLITSETIKSKPHIYKIGITALTELVQQACVSQQRDKLFPTWVYGEFCHPESRIVQEVLIPYLSQEARNKDASKDHQNIHIVALGMLTHKNVIGELTPIIEESQGQETSLRMVLAVYSLVKVGKANPNLVTPIMQTLFTNPSESTEVRIAAFNSLLKLNPPTQVFNTIAHTTRQEPNMDYELLKTINIALYTLGHSVQTTHLPQEKMDLMQKCKDAYVIAKKTYGITPSSGTYYRTEFLKDLGVGYHGFVHWVSSQESVLPKSVFAKLNMFLESMSMNVFEIGYRLSGAESLYEKVSDVLNGHSGQFSSSSLRQQIAKGLSNEWKSVMEKLKLQNRDSSEKLEGSFYLKGFGSGILFDSFSESTSQLIQQKIVESIRNPIPSSFSKDTEINVQKSFILTPVIVVGASEMGFPINIEIYTPVTTSFIGKMEVKSENQKPSASVEGKLLYSAQVTGWVGTIVPFTKEYSVTGIDQHLLVHVPGTIRVKANIPEQKVSVTVKPGAGSSSGETDILHYHVRPYTVKEKILDLVPQTKSQNMELIKSNTQKKEGQYNFGENLGLSMKVRYETESTYTDLRSVLDTLRMYKYSPLNMAIFPFSTPAFNEKMRPSTRRQEYTVTINPSESSTKEIQAEVKIGCAGKNQQQMQYHSVMPISERLSNQDLQQSVEGVSPSIAALVKKVLPYRIQSEAIESVSKHHSRAQKIQQVLQGLGETESAQGITLDTKVILIGNRPRTFGYSLTVAAGKHTKQTRRTEQKWNLHLENTQESETLPKKICIKGKLDFPLLPMWNINSLRTSLSEFNFQNKIEFGQTCSESSITTEGTSHVSNKQQSHAAQTQEFRKCEELTDRQVEGAQLSQACQVARQQASSMDEVVFNTVFKNVPQTVKNAEKKTITILKSLLWPYYNFEASPNHGSESSTSSTYSTKTTLVFKQKTPSFDLSIKRPSETITFSNIHIPEPYSVFFPLKADMSGMSLVRQVTGSSIYPTCKVTSRSVQTYDKKTIAFNPDKCFHLLTADCSKYRRFGVSARKLEGENLEVKVYLKNTVINMLPSGSEGPKVIVDGNELKLSVNNETVIHLHGSSEQILATLTKTVDRVVVLKAKSVYLPELAFNGKLISVVPSPMLKNRLCGLCGDYNQKINAEIAGPKKCVFSKPELKVASYRIESENCPSLPVSVKSQLLEESQQCAMFRTQPSKVAQSYKINTGRCTLLRHIIMSKNNQVCISKVPVTQCGPSCKTIQSELIQKTVPFVCFRQGRLADYYVSKVQQGKPVNELRSEPTSFQTQMDQPRHCVHALVN